MDISEKVKIIYPQLTALDFMGGDKGIVIQDDSDGRGAYIAEWNHPTLLEPTDEQLEAI